MGKIYIMRHGDYESASLSRALTPEGVGDVQKVARYLKDQCRVQVQAIWHSPKERAVETARILGQILECQDFQQKEELSPNAFPDRLLQALQDCDRDVMIVTHLPFIPHLLSKMFSENGHELPSVFSTASVAMIQRDGEHWAFLNFISPDMI